MSQSLLNVIVFGETGAGKSSVINMILGSDKAKVGDGALGETFRTTAYPVEIDGKTYLLHDTVGLGEHSGGTVDSAKAVGNLYRLVTDLSNSGGVNLLVFVIKCGRLTETIHKNYGLFYQGFCDSQVPVVMVVTGCEDVEPTMDTWWIDNQPSFELAKMSFDDHACVCAFKGSRGTNGKYRNGELVEESAEVVKQLIVQRCMRNGWKKPPIVWLQKVIGSMIDLFRSSKIPAIYAELYERLINVFSNSEAEEIINAVILSNRSIPNIVFFGEPGAGKSSVINMILGDERAKVADGDTSQTLRSAIYPVQIHGRTYNLYDTMGLKYGSDTIDDNGKALGNLYRLVTDLSDSGGVNLIVFVIKPTRLTRSLYQNYTLFHRGFCDSKVPIVMVVTGCEDMEPTMDTWWIEHEPSFTLSGMSFADHACVCAFNGTRVGSGRYSNEDRFKKSREVVSKLLVQHCMSDGWKNQQVDPPRSRMPFLQLFRLAKTPAVYTSLYDRLTNTLSRSEAEKIINAIRKTGQSV